MKAKTFLLVLSYLQLVSSDSPCSEQEYCVDQNLCSSFQDQVKEVQKLRKVWISTQNETIHDEWLQKRNSLLSKSCNKRPRKICCSDCCVSEERCPRISQLKENTRENLDLLRSLVCDKRNELFDCCKANPPNDRNGNGESEEPPSGPYASPSFLPSAEKGECGLNSLTPSNIIGGNDTKLGEYPFMAILGRTSDNGKVDRSVAQPDIHFKHFLEEMDLWRNLDQQMVHLDCCSLLHRC